MKIRKQERFAQRQRQYHQQHPWRLSKDGLYIPHSYAETKPDSLSWWDDVGFILNDRRVIVWWRHPRYIYSAAIDEQSWEQAGPDPQDDWLFEGATTNYKPVGKSRKKIVSYTCRPPSAAQETYYDNLRTVRQRMEAVARTLAAVQERAPQSLREGLQLLWIYQILASGRHGEPPSGQCDRSGEQD